MALQKPTGVVPSDPSVEVFYRIVASAYTDLYNAVNSTDTTDKSRRRELMRQIEQIAQDADENTKAWIKVEIPAFYEQAMFETSKMLHERGSEIDTGSGFANFHREAIEAMSQEFYAGISPTLTGITRTGAKLVGMGAQQGVLEKIATGAITGASRKDISKSIMNELKREGITAIVDKRGREWSLQTYSETLARTKLTQAHNTGVANRMVEAGYDLVIISSHFGACELCATWENQILSVTGKTKGYITLDSAKANGLFHPNCRHTMTPYHSAYLEGANIYDWRDKTYKPFDQIQDDYIQRNRQKIIDALKLVSYEEAYTQNIGTFNPKEQTYTVYRGEGGNSPLHNADSYGKGKYYTTDPEYAKNFGEVTKTTITVKNPLEISSQKDLDKYTRQMIQDGYDDIAKWAKSKGYDAIIDHETDIINLLLD